MALSNQSFFPQFLGFAPSSGQTTFGMSSANNWLTIAINPDRAKTINAVKIFASVISGTLADGGLSCDVYSDTAGTGPNASLATTSTVTGGHPTGAGWIEFTGLSLALTAGTQYWLVFKNNNGTPGSNFPTIRFGTGNGNLLILEGGNARWGRGGIMQTTTGAAPWTISGRNTWGWRVQYSDGTYEGAPFSAAGTVSGASGAFGKQGVGVKFTSPNCIVNIHGASFIVATVGTPGPLAYKLYNGTTLLSTTLTMPKANLTVTDWFPLYFPAADVDSGLLTVQPNTVLRLIVCDTTTSDTNANSYGIEDLTVENDANSQALLPFQGTLSKTLTTDYTVGSPTFADGQVDAIPFALLLDSAGEFL